MSTSEECGIMESAYPHLVIYIDIQWFFVVDKRGDSHHAVAIVAGGFVCGDVAGKILLLENCIDGGKAEFALRHYAA